MRLAVALLSAIALAACASGGGARSEIGVPMALTSPTGPGASVGEVRFRQADEGVEIQLNLRGLPPGEHGFHIHANPSCANTIATDGAPILAGAAGPHMDLQNAGHHAGPTGAGHLGDLPRFTVDAEGRARGELIAPRLSLSQIAGRALMIHVGGDNYSDTPQPLGGGGARLACGVVR